MDKIQMVDLYGQYMNIKNEIDQAIQQVINDSSFIKGKDVNLFEEELARYLESENVIACANGTDALQIALMSLGIGQDDEIITPDFTFISTVEVCALLKLKPVLVDVDPKTFNISTEAIEKAITKKTKAIIPVHLYGQCSDMEAIMKIAEKYNLYVIEDNAQAIGAEYIYENGNRKKSGTLGNIGCTSFFPSKNLGCFGDGGAICTDDKELAEKIKGIANHGSKVKYYNDYIGINSRLDTLQATVLRVKLNKLDDYCKARQKVADYYDNAFCDSDQIEIPYRFKKSTHVFHQYTILLDPSVDRNDLKNYLQGKNIPSMIYYPVPMHRQNAYKYLTQPDTDFPVTNDITNRVLSLPMHTELKKDQIEYISGTIKEYFK